jgi:hypothetical protein
MALFPNAPLPVYLYKWISVNAEVIVLTTHMIELTSSVPALEPATPPAAPFITVNAWAPFARPFFVNTGEDVHWPPLVDPPLFKLLKLSAASPSIWAVKAPPLEEGTILNEISVPGTIHQFKFFEEDKKTSP